MRAWKGGGRQRAVTLPLYKVEKVALQSQCVPTLDF